MTAQQIKCCRFVLKTVKIEKVVFCLWVCFNDNQQIYPFLFLFCFFKTHATATPDEVEQNFPPFLALEGIAVRHCSVWSAASLPSPPPLLSSPRFRLCRFLASALFSSLADITSGASNRTLHCFYFYLYFLSFHRPRCVCCACCVCFHYSATVIIAIIFFYAELSFVLCFSVFFSNVLSLLFLLLLLLLFFLKSVINTPLSRENGVICCRVSWLVKWSVVQLRDFFFFSLLVFCSLSTKTEDHIWFLTRIFTLCYHLWPPFWCFLHSAAICSSVHSP